MFQELKQNILRYKWTYLFVAVCLFIDYSLWLVPTQVVQYIIDAIGNDSLIAPHLNEKLMLLFGSMVVVYVMQIVWQWLLFGRSIRYNFELKIKMYDKLVSMRTPYFEKFRSGDLMTRFTNDIQSMSDLLGYGIMTILLSLGTVIVVLPMMFFISWKITVLAMIPPLLVSFPMHYVGTKQEEAVEQNREAVSDLSNEVLEVIEGIRVTRAYGKKSAASASFRQKTAAISEKSDKIMVYGAFFGRVATIIISLTLVILIWLGVQEVEMGNLTVGQIVALQIYSLALMEPMWMLTDYILVHQSAKVAWEKISELLSASDDLEADGTRRLEEAKEYRFENYSFQYHGASQASLQNISVKLAKGQTLGVVGKTGSGKTTFIRQFLRQYPVGDGQFTINDYPVTAYQRASIEEKIGYVPQEHILFSRTVKENIAMGKPNASLKEIDVAVAIAAFSQDLQRMTDGYETLVGEKGVSISGGQKQRISIARAMLRQPELLILDDALSAVDARTERVIIENIQTLRQGQTTVITTHRLSAVAHADIVIVLDNGVIVESGTPEELLALNGWYAEQYAKQRLNEMEEV